MSPRTAIRLLHPSLFTAVLVLLPAAASAQGLADVAKKEKQRRAENGATDIRVIDDGELAKADSDRFSVTGVDAEAGDEESPPSAPSTATAVETAPSSNSDACLELRSVEAEIARLKKTEQVRRVPRQRRTYETISQNGTRERMVITTPAHTLNATAQYSERIAALRKRWVELRKSCSP